MEKIRPRQLGDKENFFSSYNNEGEKVKIERASVIENVALMLQKDPNFSLKDGATVNETKARAAIREVIREHFKPSLLVLFEKQIIEDAKMVLELLS